MINHTINALHVHNEYNDKIWKKNNLWLHFSASTKLDKKTLSNCVSVHL